MLPDLSVLLALLLGLSALQGPRPSTLHAVLGTAACVVVCAALTRLASRRGVRAAQEGDLLVAAGAARWAMTWPLLAWVAALLLFEWGAFVGAAVPRMAWLGRYVVLLLPLAVAFGFGWAARGELEGVLARVQGGLPRYPSAAAAVRGGFRRNGLVLAPMFFLIGVLEGIWVLGRLGVAPLDTVARWIEHMPLLELGILLAVVMLALPVLPRLIARMMGAEPMPAGPLRTRLEEGARAIGLRFGQIRVWRTGRRVLNAMVVGVTPRTRTIFLSDRLIADLPEDELMAVFFHEAGHAKRHHLVLYLVMFFTLAGLMHVAEEPLIAAGLSPLMVILLYLGAVWFVLLGFVSRRFEREADLFGAEHGAMLERDPTPVVLPGLPDPLPAGAAAMIRALDRLRIATGGRGPSHRHGTLEARMGYIAAYATRPEVREAFARNRRSLLLGIAVAAVVALAGLVERFPVELERAHAGIALDEGQAAHARALDHLDAGRTEAARAGFREVRARLTDAATRLGASEDAAGRAIAAGLRLEAAGLALDRLGDDAGALALLEATDLEALDRVPHTVRIDGVEARLRHELLRGRLAARAGAFEEATRHLEAATQLERRLAGAPSIGRGERLLAAERLRLLHATIDARAALAAEAGVAELATLARERLADLAGGSNPDAAWRQLRAAAQQELDTLNAALPP